MKIFLIILFVLFILVMAAGFYMARFACLRDRKIRNYWEHPEDLPPPYEHIPKEDYGLVEEGQKFLISRQGKPITITSRDGLRLQAHYIPAEGEPEEAPKGIYLQIHGYRSHPLFDFVGATLTMHNEGYGLFLIDHRASGGSEGKYITFGLKERYDVVDWCRYIQNAFPGVPVILDGISMGGAVVMLALGEDDLPPNVRGAIADCGYTSPAAICKKVLKQWFRLPPFPIYYAAVLWIRLLTGVWFSYPGKSEKSRRITGDCSLALQKNRLPIVMAHGENDGFVPHRMSAENFRHCDPAVCEFISVPGAEHGVAYLVDKQSYGDAIARLRQKVEADTAWRREIAER